MNKQRGFTIVELLMAVIVCFAIGGWVANLYKLVSQASVGLSDITLMMILRIIGVVLAPLGAVLGYF